MSDFLQLSFAGVSQGAVYALIAIGFVAIFTVSGVINLVQGEFAALAALEAQATCLALTVVSATVFVLRSSSFRLLGGAG